VCEIEWAGERLELSCERAIHWPRRKTLIIADPHFGKAAAFRHHGVPVPAGTTQANLDRLSRLIDQWSAERLVVLGDFLHARAARASSTMNAIETWRNARRAISIVLVRGNHDLNAGDPPSEWDFQCADEPLRDEGFAWCHEPQRVSKSHVMAGHVHPCVVLRDIDGSSVRTPCFHFGSRIATLPAFGRFTGSHPIRTVRGDRVFAVGSEVIELRTAVAR
jgi:uncharacterized protein